MQMSRSVIGNRSRTVFTCDMKLRCESITPFGSPVVPEV
jgi:hypothetical protein